MLGYEEAEIGSSPDEWFSRVHHDDLARVRDGVAAHLSSGSGHYESEHRILHRDGTFRWVLCRGAATRNETETATRLAGSLTDITETKVADALTGLPNRLLFDDLLDRAIKRPARRPGLPVRAARARSRPVQGGQPQPGAAHGGSAAGRGRRPASRQPAIDRRRHAGRARVHAGAARRRRVHGPARRHRGRERRRARRRAAAIRAREAVRRGRAGGVHVGQRRHRRQHDGLRAAGTDSAGCGHRAPSRQGGGRQPLRALRQRACAIARSPACSSRPICAARSSTGRSRSTTSRSSRSRPARSPGSRR